jgi:hypothetical protein
MARSWYLAKLDHYTEQGEWCAEIDKLIFTDTLTGYPIMIVRGLSGTAHLCGYVGVPQSHPFYGLDYDTAHELGDIDVHGGLTFANLARKNINDRNTFYYGHGQPNKKWWWFGFDCAHYHDIAPYYAKHKNQLSFFKSLGVPHFLNDGAVYRNTEFVENEALNLAKQLKGVAMDSLIKDSAFYNQYKEWCANLDID